MKSKNLHYNTFLLSTHSLVLTCLEKFCTPLPPHKIIVYRLKKGPLSMPIIFFYKFALINSKPILNPLVHKKSWVVEWCKLLTHLHYKGKKIRQFCIYYLLINQSINFQFHLKIKSKICLYIYLLHRKQFQQYKKKIC